MIRSLAAVNSKESKITECAVRLRQSMKWGGRAREMEPLEIHESRVWLEGTRWQILRQSDSVDIK